MNRNEVVAYVIIRRYSSMYDIKLGYGRHCKLFPEVLVNPVNKVNSGL